MKKLNRKASAVAASLTMGAAALLGAAPVAQAADGAELQDAVESVADGTWTEADLDLIRQNPELAAMVPDPEADAEVEISDSTEDDGGISTRAAKGTKTVNVSVRNRSLLGSTIYEYKNTVTFSYSGGKVTKWGSRSYSFPYKQGVVDLQKRTVNTASATGKTTAKSTMEHQVKLCAPIYGCYANNYPKIEITAKGTGGYTSKTKPR
ncbi:hypothetical protein AB0J38_14590 [Streptomyces sp. NPDC050095]|uniref:hypothetical protein n=1 Tax=unclassified Streptomyces TaxID=2593676 RepID=UPI00341AF127